MAPLADQRTARREQAAVLTVVETCRGPWYRAADRIAAAGGALALLGGGHADVVDRWVADLDRRLAAGDDVLLTVSDPEYPANLRAVFNRPPFLFVKGRLEPADQRAVAVVGTRRASDRGLATARVLAGDLSAAGFTIVSGLARGVDTAAHAAALEAGGRTLAVLGHGIDQPVYPAANRSLAESIITAAAGALVSQFWPGAPGRPGNFPLRNVVTSGLSLATVVVEASATSGAKSQARRALEHGKHLFLLESLVRQEEWARRYAEHPAATVVADAAEITSALTADTRGG